MAKTVDALADTFAMLSTADSVARPICSYRRGGRQAGGHPPPRTGPGGEIEGRFGLVQPRRRSDPYAAAGRAGISVDAITAGLRALACDTAPPIACRKGCPDATPDNMFKEMQLRMKGDQRWSDLPVQLVKHLISAKTSDRWPGAVQGVPWIVCKSEDWVAGLGTCGFMFVAPRPGGVPGDTKEYPADIRGNAGDCLFYKLNNAECRFKAQWEADLLLSLGVGTLEFCRRVPRTRALLRRLALCHTDRDKEPSQHGTDLVSHPSLYKPQRMAPPLPPAPLEFVDTDGDLNKFVVRHGNLFYEPRGCRVEELRYSEENNILHAAGSIMSFREQGAALNTLLRKLSALAEMAGVPNEGLLLRGVEAPLTAGGGAGITALLAPSAGSGDGGGGDAPLLLPRSSSSRIWSGESDMESDMESDGTDTTCATKRPTPSEEVETERRVDPDEPEMDASLDDDIAGDPCGAERMLRGLVRSGAATGGAAGPSTVFRDAESGAGTPTTPATPTICWADARSTSSFSGSFLP